MVDFGDQHLSEVFKSELRSRRRKSGESLPALAQDVSRLVQRAYPDIGRPGVDELAIEKFREALSDHEQRVAVYQSKARTLDPSGQGCHRHGVHGRSARPDAQHPPTSYDPRESQTPGRTTT